MLINSLRQSLAIIADLYNPVLLIISLFVCVQMWKQGHRLYWSHLAVAAFVVYIVMFLDKWLGIWAHLHLDYSTHTAAALGMIMFISAKQSMQVKATLGISLIIYVAIMNFLNYHSLADMVTTAIFIGVLINFVDKIILEVILSRYRDELS